MPPDDQNTTQNPIPEENSIPTSLQEPTEPALENTPNLGEPRPSVPVESLESDGGDLKGVEYDNIPPPESLKEAESGSGKFASDGERIIVDHINKAREAFNTSSCLTATVCLL